MGCPKDLSPGLRTNFTGHFHQHSQETIVTADNESNKSPRISMPQSQAQTGRKITGKTSSNNSPLRFKNPSSGRGSGLGNGSGRNPAPSSAKQTISSEMSAALSQQAVLRNKTAFGQQFVDLIDSIREIYPDWDDQCPYKIQNTTRSTDSFPATQVFS